MSAKISPLAPKTYATLPPIEGMRIATAEAGIKYKNRTDLLLVVFDKPAAVAGVFTKSKCPSAPVDHCRKSLTGGKARALVVNSGNANAFTGSKGVDTTKATAKAAAEAAGCKPGEVFLASTGVIGEPLDAGKFSGLLAGMAKSAEGNRWFDAAKAIMTTDTYPKVATETVDLGGVTVTLNGIAKGAGMIAPDMATMLSFLATDAPISAPVLQKLLSKYVETSFNAVTVDSDTSTSDTLLLFATGAAAKRGAPKIDDASDKRLKPFKAALERLMHNLALQVVRDGEGARKMVEVLRSRRGLRQIRQAHRPLHRQLPPGQNRRRRRGRQLGPRRHGRRQKRRTRRPRPPVRELRRHPGGP